MSAAGMRAWILALGIAVAAGAAGSLRAAGTPPVREPRYAWLAARGARTTDSLQKALGPERFEDLLRLNRVDAEHLGRLDTLVVPDSASFGREGVFPDRLRAADSLRTLLVVAQRVQAFAAYDSGRLVRSGPVNSGKASTPTSPGVYWANWKAALHRSTVDSTWIMPWTVNFENREGLALHHYALPGYPASHCCVRLLESDARWIFDWVTTWTVSPEGRDVIARGTPIVVLGTYDFDAVPPWRRLPGDPTSTRLGEREVRDLDEQIRTALGPRGP